jgi:hypothetical protein
MESSDQLHITISWLEAYNGGNVVNEWNIYWDQGTGVWALSDPATVTYPDMTYTKTGLEAGVFYKFKVSAVNDIGESELSAESPSIIAALVPL